MIKKVKLSKIVLASVATFFVVANFIACSSDSSSSTFSMEKSFEILLKKEKYTYDKKDSTLKIISPVCKTGTLGNLVGPNDKNAEWDTLKYESYVNKNIAKLIKGDSVAKFSFEGKNFPVGLWENQEYDSKKIQSAFRLDKKNMFNTVISYDGSCFMKDYFSLFRKGNPALQFADSALTNFYASFLGKKDTLNEKTMLSDIRVPNCDEMTLYDGLVKLELSDINESSGKITASFEKDECPITFKIRYAFDQADCNAAFEDFNDDKESSEEFDFNDYSVDVDLDEFCIPELILHLQKANNISVKSANPRLFAKSAVKLMLMGFN